MLSRCVARTYRSSDATYRPTTQMESLDHLEHLHLQLRPLEELHHKYTSYQYAYNKLVLELARRRQYREAAQRVVANTIAELDAMVEGALAPGASFFSMCDLLWL